MVDVNLREWAVVRTANGSYLGKFGSLEGATSPIEKQDEVTGQHYTIQMTEQEAYEAMRDEALELLDGGGMLTVTDALDFLCQLRTVPQRNHLGETRPVFEKQPIVTALDMVLGDGVPIHIRPTSVYFCGDLSGNDADLYKGLIANALDMRHRSRLTAMNIELAGHLPALHGT